MSRTDNPNTRKENISNKSNMDKKQSGKPASERSQNEKQQPRKSN